MTPEELTELKELVGLIEENDEDLRDFSAQKLLYFDEFKAKDKTKSEIASFKEIHAKYLAIVEEMVQVLANITPDNTQESGTEVSELKIEYLKYAHGLYLTSLDIVHAANLDEDVYLKTLTEFIEKTE